MFISDIRNNSLHAILWDDDYWNQIFHMPQECTAWFFVDVHVYRMHKVHLTQSLTSHSTAIFYVSFSQSILLKSKMALITINIPKKIFYEHFNARIRKIDF